MSHREPVKVREQERAGEQTRAGVYVKTFGCQMNEYDSEKVVRLLSETHQPVAGPEDAELVVINTCSVREKGEHKLFSLLGSLRELKRERPDLVIGVMGCVAQQEGEAIAKRNNAVDFVVGTHNLSLVPGIVRAVKGGLGRQIAVDYRDEWEDLPLGFSLDDSFGDTKGPDWIANRVRALVSIQRGCDKNCSYCVVPVTRGREVSRSAEEIVREVRLKARLGAREVLLLGQTVNSYGRDLTPRYRFETLIREIAEVPGIARIRFISPHPAEVRPAFLDLYTEVPQLSPHIHLPVQSGSDRILKLMNRNYKRHRFLEIVAAAKERVPEIAITTDVIVGFPTETAEDFQQTLDLVEEVGFISSFSFRYSRRPNTTAISAFSIADEVPREVAEERLHALQSLQHRLSADYNGKMVGRTAEVLVEDVRLHETGYGLSQGWGRTAQNVPVEIMSGCAEVREGELVSVLVEHGTAHGLKGRLNPPAAAAGEGTRL